jgi:hypothetical protein
VVRRFSMHERLRMAERGGFGHCWGLKTRKLLIRVCGSRNICNSYDRPLHAIARWKFFISPSKAGLLWIAKLHLGT